MASRASIIQERITAGIARARAQGTKSGKAFGRPKIPPEREDAVRASLAVGTGIRKTARLIGTGNATVARIAAEMRSVDR
jgi:DNA invertase Pin-like site-specific DNA recombinase